MQKYNEGNLAKYHTKNPLKRKMVERLNEKIIDELSEMMGDVAVTILDAGCGEGFISRLVAERFPKAQVTGLEYTNEALSIAKGFGDGIFYVQGDVTNLPFDDNSFDYVVCTEVLEHLEKPEKALNELLRVCRKNGGILITVPHEPWFCIGNIVAFKNLSRFGNPIDHINHWTFREFRNFIGRQADNVLYSKSFPWSLARIKVIN